MTLQPELIAEFVSDIWRLLVGRPAEPTAAPPPTAADWVYGCVQITGAWRGTVTVAAPPGVVRALAAAIGGLSAERPVDGGRATDALGELTSMIAGNLKAVLPPPCYLSKPAVAAGDGGEPDGVDRRRVLRAGFADPAGAFAVTVAESPAPTARRRHPERPSGINPLSDSELSGRYPRVAAEEYVTVVTPAPVRPAATPPDSVR
jgi:hypothetical protein